MNTNKRFLTIKEFCEQGRISRTTLYRHIKSGRIPHIKLGGRVLISSQIIDSMVKEAGERYEA
jgi:excisionase family DNA binding protein